MIPSVSDKKPIFQWHNLPPFGVQCITHNKIPIKLPRTKQFGHKTTSNQFFWEFFARTKLKQTKLYWKKNQMWKLSQLNKPGKSDKCWFQNMLQLRQLRSEDRVIIEMIPKMISTCRFKDFFLGKQNKCIDIFTENVYFRI